MHDPAIGLLSSHVQDRAIGLRPLSLIGPLVARSHRPPPHGKPLRLLLPSLTDLVSTYQAMQSLSYRQREDPPPRTPEAVPQNVLSRRACLECHRQKQRCNKQQPCLNCIRRGISHSCVWPVDSRRHRLSQQINTPRQASTPRTPVIDVAEHLRGSQLTAVAELLPSATLDGSSQPGRLYKMRDAPSYHGNSYFGHHSAAAFIGDTSPDLSSGIHIGYSHRTHLGGSTQPFRSERGPYAQLWELLGSLPRRKAVVDKLLRLFLLQLNDTFDAIHEETFMRHYEEFWDRKAGCDDLANLNLRWLSVLFIILAFGELLDCPQPCSVEAQRDCEDSSLHFYWSARKSLVIAPSFYGESPDLTRAGILITRYLIYTKRISESWLTGSFAVRMAQAQGMHVDGEHLRLPKKVIETRRRLWSQLYFLDISIALALGRPNSINEKHCVSRELDNIWVDDLSNEEAAVARPLDPQTCPTPTTLLIFQHRLARIIAQIYDMQFVASATSDPSAAYDAVLRLEDDLQRWAGSLPSYFSLVPNHCLDQQYAYLRWHRQYLHSAFHFARMTLHRAFLFRPSITNRFQTSRDACISSACADLKIKLSLHSPTMADRVKAHVGAHQLSNSALILGIITVQSPHGPQTDAILSDLQSYCYQQSNDSWLNEYGLAETRVVELCIVRAMQARQTAGLSQDAVLSSVSSRSAVLLRSDPASTGTATSTYEPFGPSHAANKQMGHCPSQISTDVQSWSFNDFPELTDFAYWEGLIDNLSGLASSHDG